LACPTFKWPEVKNRRLVVWVCLFCSSCRLSCWHVYFAVPAACPVHMVILRFLSPVLFTCLFCSSCRLSCSHVSMVEIFQTR